MQTAATFIDNTEYRGALTALCRAENVLRFPPQRRVPRREIGRAISTLPPPRMIPLSAAAHHCGVGEDRFGALIAEGKLPAGIDLGTRGLRWDIKAIDLALDRLSGLASTGASVKRNWADLLDGNADSRH